MWLGCAGFAAVAQEQSMIPGDGVAEKNTPDAVVAAGSAGAGAGGGTVPGSVLGSGTDVHGRSRRAAGC